MNISREEEFVNQELKQLRFQVTKEIVQQMKTVMVKNTTKWNYMPPWGAWSLALLPWKIGTRGA